MANNPARSTSIGYQFAGYSLLELMISTAMLLVFLAVAAPSFSALIARTELTTHASSLFDSLYLARAQAMTRRQTIHVCQLESRETKCSDNYQSKRSWSQGWMIFADVNENNNFDTGDELLRVIHLADTINIVFNQRGRLRFFADGSARSAGFYLCDKQQRYTRHILLLHSGRVRMHNRLSKRHRTTCAGS